jgi:rubrerythrin
MKTIREWIIWINVFLVFVLCAGMYLACAQDAPKSKEPTVAELKLQLVQKDVQLANLNLQLLQTQEQLVAVLKERAEMQVITANKALGEMQPRQTKTAKQ